MQNVNHQALIAQYEPLVRQIAGAFQRKVPCHVLREDLIAAGMSGLWDAVRKQDQTPAEGFEWYVRVRVRGAILDELRHQDWLPRRARKALSIDSNSSVPAVVRFDDVSEYEQNKCLQEAGHSEETLHLKALMEQISEVIEQLPERERYIITQHYMKGVKFKDLSLQMGVSEPRISQLHSRAMDRIRKASLQASM